MCVKDLCMSVSLCSGKKYYDTDVSLSAKKNHQQTKIFFVDRLIDFTAYQPLVGYLMPKRKYGCYVLVGESC